MSGIEGIIDSCKWKYQWVMKDGNKIRIRDMTDNHLVNTIKFLLRRTSALILRNQRAFLGGGYPQGEAAQDAYDREERYWNEITSHELLVESCVPFPFMLKEAERRGLDMEELE